MDCWCVQATGNWIFFLTYVSSGICLPLLMIFSLIISITSVWLPLSASMIAVCPHLFIIISQNMIITAYPTYQQPSHPPGKYQAERPHSAGVPLLRPGGEQCGHHSHTGPCPSLAGSACRVMDIFQAFILGISFTSAKQSHPLPLQQRAESQLSSPSPQNSLGVGLTFSHCGECYQSDGS